MNKLADWARSKIYTGPMAQSIEVQERNREANDNLAAVADMLEQQQAEIERLRAERDEARNIARQYFDPLASDGVFMVAEHSWLEASN